MRRILVVEDEESLRLLLEYDLKEQGYQVRLCSDGKKALEILEKEYFDLVVMDWMLPSMSGYDVVKEIRCSNKIVKIIMVSAKDNELDIIKGLEVGANDYLKKPFSSRELLARIKVQLREEQAKENKQIKFNDYYIDDSKKIVYCDGEEINLTKTEYNILFLLANNLDQVVSKKDILKHIWNYDESSDTGLIDVHIHRLKKKLKISNKELENKRGIGYRLKDEN